MCTGPSFAIVYGSLMEVECATPTLERSTTSPLAQTVRFLVGITCSPLSYTHAILSSIPSKLHTMSTDSPVVDAVNISNEKVPSMLNKYV